MVSQEPAKLSWAQVQSGFESRQFRQKQRSTICLVMYSIGKCITLKWRSYARVRNPEAKSPSGTSRKMVFKAKGARLPVSVALYGRVA